MNIILLIFKMNFEKLNQIHDINKHITDFYIKVLESWINIGGGSRKNADKYFEIRKEIIWGNKNIMIHGKTLIFNNWIGSNMIFIEDIMDTNGEIHEKCIYD